MRRVPGRGWSIGLTRGKYQASIVYKDGKKKFIAYANDMETALEYAVSAAAKYATLSWASTLKWGRLNGYPITYKTASRPLPPADADSRKGWFVESSCWSKLRGVERKRSYSVSYGRSVIDATYQATRASKRTAIIYALNRRYEIPDYNEAATIHYLHRIGMDDLMPLAILKGGDA